MFFNQGRLPRRPLELLSLHPRINGVLACSPMVVPRSGDLPPSPGRYKDSGRSGGTSPRVVLTAGKGKGKSLVSPDFPPPVEKAASLPSLEVLMTDLTSFEETFLNYLEDEVISGLVSMYGKVAIKKVQDLLRDSTPFQMAASVILC